MQHLDSWGHGLNILACDSLELNHMNEEKVNQFRKVIITLFLYITAVRRAAGKEK